MTSRINPTFCIQLLSVIVSVFIVAYSCTDRTDANHQIEIDLRWIKSFEGESKEKVMTGLMWNLSFLGAALPRGSMRDAVTWKDDSRFTLKLSRVGFSKQALAALNELVRQLKESDEYKSKGAIDLGRFISLTLTSSYHYYRITGVSSTLTEFRSHHTFEDSLAAIVESGVALGNRVIEIAKGNTLAHVAFIAHEGFGTLADSSFQEKEFESFDFMPNGQLRFVIYDSLGKLKSSGSAAITNAGKPSKCLWCHEIGIHLPFAKTDVPGYYSLARFKELITEKMAIVEKHRSALDTDIDFSQRQDHTQAELLYLTFMEPSAERLALEWELSVDSVQVLLTNVTPHKQKEFSILGDKVYYRHEIDSMAPYEHLQVPTDAREPSLFEPDYLTL